VNDGDRLDTVDAPDMDAGREPLPRLLLTDTTAMATYRVAGGGPHHQPALLVNVTLMTVRTLFLLQIPRYGGVNDSTPPAIRWLLGGGRIYRYAWQLVVPLPAWFVGRCTALHYIPYHTTAARTTTPTHLGLPPRTQPPHAGALRVAIPPPVHHHHTPPATFSAR